MPKLTKERATAWFIGCKEILYEYTVSELKNFIQKRFIDKGTPDAITDPLSFHILFKAEQNLLVMCIINKNPEIPQNISQIQKLAEVFSHFSDPEFCKLELIVIYNVIKIIDYENHPEREAPLKQMLEGFREFVNETVSQNEENASTISYFNDTLADLMGDSSSGYDSEEL